MPILWRRYTQIGRNFNLTCHSCASTSVIFLSVCRSFPLSLSPCKIPTIHCCFQSNNTTKVTALKQHKKLAFCFLQFILQSKNIFPLNPHFRENKTKQVGTTVELRIVFQKLSLDIMDYPHKTTSLEQCSPIFFCSSENEEALSLCCKMYFWCYGNPHKSKK